MEQSSETIDLNAYFQRIGYKGDRTATLKTLQAIHLCHTKSIAFKNLNSLLKQPVSLNLKSLEKKLIYEGRGGYCFEQNLLLRSVLLTLGFQVKNLAARVLWNIPEGRIMPRTHMLLCLDIDGQKYIADVGFGGITLTAPLSVIFINLSYEIIRKVNFFSSESTYNNCSIYHLPPNYLWQYFN
ncbi:MAG: arylamine N-acetyltransferase [Nostoc sp. TH1S01]|nr:arylamine N-acetyltransferase [Nostoc sp. TH1S01]